MNELLLLSFVLADLFLCLLFFKYAGKMGLIAFYIIHIFLVQITIQMQFDVFGHTMVFGSALFAIIFLAIDVLTEHYGKDEGYKAVRLGSASLLLFLIIVTIVQYFEPSATNEITQEFGAIFGQQIRITLSDLLISYLLLQSFDVWLYNKIGILTKGKHLWLRNNVSSLISQTLIAVFFFQAAFAGVIPQDKLWDIIFHGLLIKWAICMLETPFLYMSRSFKPKNYESDRHNLAYT